MYTTYYAQVLSIGMIWVTFHCGGMCGPLVAGLTTRRDDPPDTRGRLRARALRVFAYQSGRALTYAALGAGAGLVGASMEALIRDVTMASGFVVGPALIALGLWRALGHRLHRRRAPATPGSVGLAGRAGAGFGKVLRAMQRRSNALIGHDGLRLVFTGLIMGLLPCMLMFWVLGVAAATASPAHGAGVMVLLVAMTTPVLLAASCAAGMGARRLGERVVPFALVASGVWLLLITFAANGWIEHLHLPFHLFGEPYVVMLW